VFYQNIIDDIDELHDAVLGRNRQICGDNGKTLKFVKVAKIREFLQILQCPQKIYSLNHNAHSPIIPQIFS